MTDPALNDLQLESRLKSALGVRRLLILMPGRESMN